MNQADKNFRLGVLHEGLWGAANGFFTLATILSLALVDLGRDASTAGLLGAVFITGITLPQAFSALALPPSLTDSKPLAWAHLPSILGPLVAGLGFALTSPESKDLRVYFLFIGFGLFAVGVGVVVPHWVAFIGRTMQPSRRGRYFGTSFFASGLCGTFTGWMASRWASEGGLHWGYALCFFCSVPFLLGSVMVLTFMKPITRRPAPPPPKALRNSFRLLKEKLAEPGPFRAFVLVATLMILSASCTNLFTVYLRNESHVDASWFQVFTPVLTLGGMLGAYLLGHLADHKGVRAAYAIAAAAGLLTLGLIGLCKTPALNALGFACLGCLVNSFPVINSVVNLNLAGRGQTSIHTGFFNTLMGPWYFFAPLFAGWVAAHAGYGWAFGFAVMAGITVFWFLLKNPGLDGKK